jgi:hypothetical protein
VEGGDEGGLAAGIGAGWVVAATEEAAAAEDVDESDRRDRDTRLSRA